MIQKRNISVKTYIIFLYGLLIKFYNILDLVTKILFTQHQLQKKYET